MNNPKLKRISSLLLTLLLAVGLMTGAMADVGDDAIPTLASFTVETEVGASDAVTFSLGDFAAHVTGGSELRGIVLTALPLPADGMLCVSMADGSDRALMVGEAVTAANLSTLRFLPASADERVARFSFVPVFASGAGSVSTVTVAAIAKRNHPPVASDAGFETVKNIALTCEFPASDADGDPLSYSIVDPPKKGEVTLSPDNPDKFIYTPKQGKTGSDSFTFVATDPSGEQSNVGKITLKIVKNAAKMTYADMDGDPAHYAALKLAADGVLIGKRVDKTYYFEPDATVTRGEFVALALTCLGVDVDTQAVSTGFADDASTAAWLRPYVATAARLGIVNGSPESDGSLVFNAGAPITRAEAVVVLANAVGLDVTTSASSARLDATDVAAVPAWAEKAASSAAACGILTRFDDGSLRPTAAVTRADAAGMLWSAKTVHAELEQSGLLDKAFA